MKGKTSITKEKISRRFLRKPKGRIILNLKHKKLAVAYMYGNRYSLARIKDGREKDLIICDKLDKIVKRVEEEKETDQSDKLKRLKSISKINKK